jgi:hypothetical protein
MIDKAMTFLVGEINNVLSARFQSSVELAVLSSLADPKGNVPDLIDNRIVFTLVNVEREPAAHGNSWAMRGVGDPMGSVSPQLALNLLIMVTASFSDYTEALKFLGNVMGFFQGKPSFNAQNSGSFPNELEKLSIELVNLSFTEINNVWSVLGAKYMPSAAYKIRMLVLQENWIGQRVPAVSATASRVKG